MKYVTQSEIAKKAGVSRSAVSYILHGSKDKKFSDELRERVMKIAEEMNYRPNPFGQGLKTKKSGNIALVLTSLSDTSMTILIKAVQRTALSKGYGLIIYNLEDIENKTIGSVKTLFDKPFDGVLYCFPDQTDADIINDMSKKLSIPIVIIGNKISSISLDNVRYDYYKAGKMLAEHICMASPDKVAVAISGLDKDQISFSKQLRIDGMRKVFNSHDIKMDIIMGIINMESRSYYFDAREYDVGYRLGLDMIKNNNKYSAIVGSNDFIAAGIINALKSKGVRIPMDVSIAAFGGHLVSEIIEPKLTTIEIPTYKIAEEAFYILMNRIDNNKENYPCEEVILPALNVAKSTQQ